MTLVGGNKKMSVVEAAVLKLAHLKLDRWRVTPSRQVEAVCPFPHPDQSEERKRSKRTFYISLDTGLWICHRCGRRGQLKKLYRALGVSLGKLDQQLEDLEQRMHRSRLMTWQETDELPGFVADIFTNYGPVKLLADGFDKDVLKEHQIGMDFAMDRWTVPIFSRDGKLRAISGRAMRDGVEPKYKIYTNLDLAGIVDSDKLFNYVPKPHRYLWREDKVEDRNLVVICEGFKATLWFAQYGWHAVGLMSTSMTKEQYLKLLTLEPTRIVLALDNDEPGLIGMYELIRKIRHVAPLVVFNYQQCHSRRTGELCQEGDGSSPDDLEPEDLQRGIEEGFTPTEWRIAHVRYRRTHSKARGHQKVWWR